MEFLDLSFVVKLAATAGVVLLATFVAERAGAFVGATIAALPISAGPAYIFLALEHDAGFIAESARASLSLNAMMGPFLVAAAFGVRRFGFLPGLAMGLVCWGFGAFLATSAGLSVLSACLLNAVFYAACLVLARPMLAAPGAGASGRGLADLALRIGGVVTVVGAAILTGRSLGPEFAGVAALIPIVWISMSFVAYSRAGREMCSAILANGVVGMIGFWLALTAVASTAGLWGSAIGLALGAATSVVWNVGLLFARPYLPFLRR